MNVYIWQDVECCSANWHSDGGVVVFAPTEIEARALANAQRGCAIRDNEHPAAVREVVGGDPAVYIFPNAGCC